MAGWESARQNKSEASSGGIERFLTSQQGSACRPFQGKAKLAGARADGGRNDRTAGGLRRVGYSGASIVLSAFTAQVCSTNSSLVVSFGTWLHGRVHLTQPRGRQERALTVVALRAAPPRCCGS
jgi:hypothetical protein